MRVRNTFALLLCVIPLLLAPGSSVARGPQPTRVSEATGAESSPGAHAPWVVETVDADGDVGQYASVSIYPDWLRAQVRYYDATNGHLRGAWFPETPMGGNCGDTGDWSCQTLDPAGDVGQYSSLAVHPDGAAYAAYHDATAGALKAQPYYIGEKTIDTAIAPASTGLHTSAAINADYTPYIAYHFNNPGNVDALMIAHEAAGDGNCGVGAADGDWTCQTVITGEGMGQYTSLALDGDGHFHIAYHDAGNGDLWYATSRRPVNCGPGNSWHCYQVDATADVVGQYASMYLDSADRFHIAYYDDTNDVLKYAAYVGSGGNCAGGQAQCDEIDSMMQGYNPLGVSIAQDPAGHPIIAYQSEYGSLNVARPLAALGMPAGSGNCGPEDPFQTWYCDTVDPSGGWVAHRDGDYVSIAVDSAGLATIAYYGFITPEGGNLMVAYQRLHQFFLPLLMKN